MVNEIVKQAAVIAARDMIAATGKPADDMTDSAVILAVKGWNRKERIDHVHSTLLKLWAKCNVSQPTEGAAAVMREAIEHLFWKKKFRLLANPPRWTGYIATNRQTGEKTIDRSAVIVCLANTIGQQLEFLTGDGYLGAAVDAQFKSNMLGKELGINNLNDMVETYATLFCVLRGKRFCGIGAWSHALSTQPMS